jgi:hypothetical protein
MHHARHAGASSAFRRPRTLILLLAAGVGLAGALWLPTRNDTASATEIGRDRQHSQDRRHAWDRRHRWHPPSPSFDPSPTAVPTPSDPSTEPPSSEPPSSEPPSSAPPSTEPTAAPTTEPTTAPPAPIPTVTAPAATPWKPFIDLTAGQLVSFGGKIYQVQQTHTSLPGWEPPKLPALFKLF